MIFNIHPDQGDRLSYGVALLLNMTMYMIFISDKLPEKSDKIPFVGTLFVAFFFFLSLGLILSAYTMSCSTRTSPLPTIAYKIADIVTKVMSICCCGTRRRNKDDRLAVYGEQQHRAEYGSTSCPESDDINNQNLSSSVNRNDTELVTMAKETALIENDDRTDESAKLSPVSNLKKSVASMVGSNTAVPSKRLLNLYGDPLLTSNGNAATMATGGDDDDAFRFENWLQFMRFVEKCLTVLFAVMLVVIPLVIAASLDTSRKNL